MWVKLHHFCYIIQICRCDLDVKRPVKWASLPRHDGDSHLPGSARPALTFLILNPPDLMAQLLAPSAWKELNSSYIELVLFPTEKMGWQQQGHIKSRFLIDAHLHRELRLPGPDRRSEVGPEEHPPVRRRSWESHHIWTELRYKILQNKKDKRTGFWSD